MLNIQFNSIMYTVFKQMAHYSFLSLVTINICFLLSFNCLSGACVTCTF